MPDLDTEQKPSRRLWILAAVGALALHIGGAALAIAHLRSDDVDDSLGAPAIEIGLEMMSPHLEPTDLPPGPDAGKDRYIFLRADRAVPYGELMDVLEILRAGGYSKLKLVALEGVPDAAASQAAPADPKP